MTHEPGKTIVDVREDLKAGEEPFPIIMKAVQELTPGDSLVVLATFKPEPLISLLTAQGFESEARETDDGDWQVTFYLD